MSTNPATGVYGSGQMFTVQVVLNTAGQKVNAAEGTLSFSPKELSVVSITKGSLFNLWTAEPSFSNTAGTISFSGGNPSGYSGSGGAVISITFRTLGSGTSRVSFQNGAVLAADGRGTNVLTSMNGGSYTVSAQTSEPAPERIVEYIAPSNTPAAPIVRSDTHPDSSSWYASTVASLAWNLPSGVTGVRTLLDKNPTSVPSRLYETPISSITLDDLDEGESFFHIQFRNDDGWGKVAHYRLAVDTQPPKGFSFALPDDADLSNPEQVLVYAVEQSTSPLSRLLITIDGGDPIEYQLEAETGEITLPSLKPGYHSIVADVFNQAGNNTIATISFTILAFDKPVFTEYPNTIDRDVIPVIQGKTRPNATVRVTFTQVGAGVSSSDAPRVYEVQSDDSGIFTVIPDGRLQYGVYELVAEATDRFGAQSELSEAIRFVVTEPGYVQFGAFAISFLSIVIPLIAMTALLVLVLWFTYVRLRLMKVGVVRESREALSILATEFDHLHDVLLKEADNIVQSRKTNKLTKSEEELVERMTQALNLSESRVTKEITDVSDIVT